MSCTDNFTSAKTECEPFAREDSHFSKQLIGASVKTKRTRRGSESTITNSRGRLSRNVFERNGRKPDESIASRKCKSRGAGRTCNFPPRLVNNRVNKTGGSGAVQIQERIQRLFGRGFPPVAGNTVAEQRDYLLLFSPRTVLLDAYKHEERSAGRARISAVRISRIFPTRSTVSRLPAKFIRRINRFSMRDFGPTSDPAHYSNLPFMRGFTATTSRRA